MRVVDLAGRPDLLEPALNLGDVGGQFIYQGASGRMITGERFLRHWARYFLIALDDDGVPMARALSVPLAFPADDRAELPDHGWDQAIEWAAQDVMDGRAPKLLMDIHSVSEVNRVDLSKIDGPAHSDDFTVKNNGAQ